MTKDEALKLALEALEAHADIGIKSDKAITAIKEALAQPEQEPVATVTSESGDPDVRMSWWHEPALPVGTKLYTTPPQRTWQGLTDEEIDVIDEATWGEDHKSWGIHDFARAVEAKLKEKNSA